MKRILLATLLAMPLTASANFFFMLADSGSSPCTYTPVTTKEEAITLIREKAGMACTASLDANDDILLTCKGQNTYMFFFTPNIDRCVALLASMKRLIGQ